MADNPKCVWTGASGKEYTYYIHSNPPNFNPDQDGNYIYSKKNTDGKWVPIYIGEGSLCDRCCDGHHQATCIARKGATHVHAHLNSDEDARTSEEADLLARYTNAYKPTGCNEKIGG